MIPQFLVIGAHKSGTTWLDQNLRMHPEIWLPPEKEIHYFNLPKYISFTTFILSPNADTRRWVFNRIKRSCLKAKEDPKLLFWYMRYCLLGRTNHWYRSLFKPDAGQVAGEVTPHYAVMSDRDISAAHSLNPDMKIIYLLRNPIDRVWSHAAMQFSEKYHNPGIENMGEMAIVDFLLKPYQLSHGRYFENLRRWEKYFPKEQIFIGFLDEMAEDPTHLLSAIFQFLGVTDSAEYVSEKSSEIIYRGRYPAIPNHIAAKLAEIYLDDLEKLHQHLQCPFTAQWLSQCQSLLNSRNNDPP